MNGIRALLGKETILSDLIKSQNADVVCLQETKIDGKALGALNLRQIFVDLGYKKVEFYCCSTSGGYSGTA